MRRCPLLLAATLAHGPGYVAKVFPHSGDYKGCALFGPGAERGLSDENERWLICEIL